MTADMTSARPLIVVVAPVDPALVSEAAQREPRVDIVHEPDLVPRQLFPGDRRGDPDHRTSPEQRDRLLRLMARADALLGVPEESPASLAAAVRAGPRLRWVQAMTAGAGAQVRAAGLSQEELERVSVTTAAGVHGGPLAEFAVFGVLAGAKRLPELAAAQARREWPRQRLFLGQVARQRIAVVGLGGIGRAVAGKLVALGATVVGVHRHSVDVPGVERVVDVARLVELAPELDAVVMCLPQTAATRHLLGRPVLERLRRGATVVNVGRGSTVDEVALVDALNSGQVGLAVLDVFEQEPLPAGSPLWSHPNVIVSPHTAALDPGEDQLIIDLFVDNAGRFAEGRPLRNLVDTSEFY